MHRVAIIDPTSDTLAGDIMLVVDVASAELSDLLFGNGKLYGFEASGNVDRDLLQLAIGIARTTRSLADPRVLQSMP